MVLFTTNVLNLYGAAMAPPTAELAATRAARIDHLAIILVEDEARGVTLRIGPLRAIVATVSASSG
jgi:hypothetical protein